MGLADILGGGQPPVAQAFPVQDQYAGLQPTGLAPAVAEMPDFAAPPPQTPEEFEQRKAAWRSALENPAVQQALFVTGLSLMRPGSNLGEAGLAGFATYNAALQGQQEQGRAQRDEGRLDAREGRAQAEHTARMSAAQADAQWMATRRPLELKELEAKVASIPGQQERDALALKLKRLELEQAPEVAKLELAKLRAQIEATNRSGAAAARETDQERAVRAFMDAPELKDLPEAERRAQATSRFYQESRGVVQGMRNDRADQDALAIYQYMEANPDAPDVQLAKLDPKMMMQYARGRELYVGKSTQVAQPAPQSAPQAAPQRRVITAEEIRQQMSVAQRTSSGRITQGN